MPLFWEGKHGPVLSDSSYPPARIAAEHGNDPPPSAAEIDDCASCAGFFFAREVTTAEGQGP
jgi:hypothetical protein